MSALRVLNIDKIRDNHQQYYAPHNAALVVCGPLARDDLLNSLAPSKSVLSPSAMLHQKGLEAGSDLCRDRVRTLLLPLMEARPNSLASTPLTRRPRALRLTQSVVVRFIDFPKKDESVGEIPDLMGWSQVPRLDDQRSRQRSQHLSHRFSVSAIQKAFVERDDPLCTDAYIGSTDKAGASTLSAYFSSVPSEQLDKLDIQLVDLLAESSRMVIDMERMHMVIKRDKLKVLSGLETKPAIPLPICSSPTSSTQEAGEDLHSALEDLKRYDELLADQPTVDRVAAKVLCSTTHVSSLLSSFLGSVGQAQADTKALEADRKKKLGEEGLKKLEEQLEEAKKKRPPIPDEMLKQFHIPSTDSIKWIPVAQLKCTPQDLPLSTTSKQLNLLHTVWPYQPTPIRSTSRFRRTSMPTPPSCLTLSNSTTSPPPSCPSLWHSLPSIFR